MHAFLNDKFVDLKDVTLHVSDLAIQRGFGVFDFLKVEGSHPYFIDQYLNRFYNSAKAVNLTVPLSNSELKSVIAELISRNDLDLSGVKMILTGGYSSDGYTPTTPNLIITQQPLSLPPQGLYDKGVDIITFPYVREIPHAKTINYTMGIWLQKKLREVAAYDVLYYTSESVSEFPRSNFFLVTKEGVVVTPHRNVLHGVTRQNLISLAGKKYPVEERDVKLEEVFDAAEAFITSTTKRLLPIISVDGKTIGTGKPGAIFTSLLEDLVRLEGQFV